MRTQKQLEEGAIFSTIPGSTTRRFKIVKAATSTQPPIYRLKTDLTSVLWQSDNAVTHCPLCKKEYGFFRRISHCRSCGLCYCRDDCPEDEDHDNERVCHNCKFAEQELNKQAATDFHERVKLRKDIARKLDTIDADFEGGREEILQEEDDERLRTMDSMREQRHEIDADIRNKIASAVGKVAQMERRRAVPVYGVRAGLLKLKVQRLRSLHPVKPQMKCAPVVQVEIGSQRQRSLYERHTKIALCGGNLTEENNRNQFDFRIVHEFVFLVEDDRDGVIISVVDDTTIKDVNILLGIAYLNLRKPGVLEIDPPKSEKELALEEERNSRKKKKNQQEENKKKKPKKIRQIFDDEGEENSNDDDNNDENDEDSSSSASPSREEEQEDARVVASRAVSTAATSLYQPKEEDDDDDDEDEDDEEENQQRKEAESGEKRKRKLRNHKSSSVNSFQTIATSSRSTLMTSKKKINFSRYIEKGQSTRALCDYEGNALQSSQIVLHWEFHPFKQQDVLAATPSSSTASKVCPGCKHRDTKTLCQCTEYEKEHAEEEVIKTKLRQAGGEIHAMEREARKRKAREKGGNNSNAPFGPFDGVEIPTLRDQGADKVEVFRCCC